MTNIQVSVVIPAYNCERTVGECLDTVLGQSLREKEIIVVDDGSSDLTPNILSQYKDKLRVVRQENAGPGAARNRGIALARGEYVAFMDADDKYPSPAVLESLASAADARGAGAAGGSFLLWENGRLTSVFEGALSGYSFREDGMVDYRDYQFDYGYHRFVYRRDLLVGRGIRFPDYPRYQDPPFMARALSEAGSFCALAMPTYLYRAEPKKVAWTDAKVRGLIAGLSDELDFSREKGYEKLHRLVVERINGEFAPIVAGALAGGDPALRRPVVDLCASISGELIGEGADYLPRFASEMFAGNARTVANLVEREEEISAIRASIEYRFFRAAAYLPRAVKRGLKIGARNRSFRN
jgi:glycosyltransferase involved in cell wall biosynthesis